MSTYKVGTVYIWVPCGEFIHGLIRPVRDQQTFIWVNYDTNKWKYVRMPKVSPNDTLFAEFLGHRSEKISGRVKHNDRTDLAPPDYISPPLVNSHRTTLVRHSARLNGLRGVRKGHSVADVPVRDFGGFRNILVIVTHFTQLIQNPCSFLFINETLVQNLNMQSKVDQTEPLKDLPHPND